MQNIIFVATRVTATRLAGAMSKYGSKVPDPLVNGVSVEGLNAEERSPSNEISAALASHASLFVRSVLYAHGSGLSPGHAGPDLAAHAAAVSVPPTKEMVMMVSSLLTLLNPATF